MSSASLSSLIFQQELKQERENSWILESVLEYTFAAILYTLFGAFVKILYDKLCRSFSVTEFVTVSTSAV